MSIKLVHASVISNITKTAWQSGKKPASVVNTDLYFCQDLQLCQWNWDIRFQDIGGCCSCLCWMKRKFNFLSLIIQTISQEIHRDVKKILMTIMIAIAFPLSWFFLFQNYHCGIFKAFFPIKSQLLITHVQWIKLTHFNHPIFIIQVSTYCKLIQ